MRCATCGTNNPSAKNFCAKCGNALAKHCAKCQAENPPTSDFCGKCGTRLADGTNAAVAASSARGSAPHIRVTPESSSSEPLEGERKTVTALFADIKGSTELMEDLDPEEARAIIDPALRLMIDAAHRYDGYVVQSTGDGIFALFGAPAAHEDHPQRALYAALRMQEELKRYSAKVLAEGGTPIQGRVGINSGEVVVRSIQTGAGQVEYTPIGHTTNLASRMQTAAPVGSIAVSEATRRLCEGYFILKPLGATKVKGVSEPVDVYEITGLGPLRTRLQRSVGRGLTKFVGREREMEALKHAAEQAKGGRGQIVAAMAEPGVGKSRLFFEFKATSQSGWMVLETFSVSHGKASAYLPVIDLLRNYFDISGTDDERKRREKVTGRVLALDRGLEDTLQYLFSLLGIVEGEDPLAQMDGQIKKRRTLEAIKRIVLRESLNQPLMVIFEDLHWIDEQTQELLNVLTDSIGTAKILLLVNYRPEYLHQWGSKTYYTQLRLDPLGKESADEMLSALLRDGPELAPLKRMIIEKTEGNPFFMEETVQVLLDEGALVRNGTTRLTKPLNDLKIPPTVQAILAARIDRLAPDHKDLLQTLAVMGKEFSLSLVRQVIKEPDDEISRMLNDLQLAEFIYEQPASGDIEYIFKHALTQEVAYNSVLLERRRVLHGRIGQSIEAQYADALAERALELAHHYSRSTDAAKAVHYLELATRQSLKRSSPQQAAELADRGLKLIDKLPEDARYLAELSLLIPLIVALVDAHGYAAPQLEGFLNRAMDLCSEAGTRPQLFQILIRRLYYHAWKAEWSQNLQVGQRMLAIANEEKSNAMIAEAHIGLFDNARMSGKLIEARDHVAAVSELATSSPEQKGFDRKLWMGRARWGEAMVFWDLGYPDDAKRSALNALEVIRSYNDARQLAQLLNNCHPTFALSGDTNSARRMVDEALDVAERFGLRTQLAWAKFNQGCTLVLEGNPEQGIDRMTTGMLAHEAAGNRIKTWMLGPLADAYRAVGKAREGLDVTEKALALTHQTGELLWVAELHRLRGELIMMDSGDIATAEECFRQAITFAQGQQAKSWELRATISLARLLASQGSVEVARIKLREIVAWFTEGLETTDIREAKSLLTKLVA